MRTTLAQSRLLLCAVSFFCLVSTPLVYADARKGGKNTKARSLQHANMDSFEILERKWYAFKKELFLGPGAPEKFQLFQPYRAMTNDRDVAVAMDAVPPRGLVNQLALDQASTASSDIRPAQVDQARLSTGMFALYGQLVISYLLPVNTNYIQLLQSGGDPQGYNKWLEYRKQVLPPGARRYTRFDILKALEDFVDLDYEGRNAGEVKQSYTQYLQSWQAQARDYYSNFLVEVEQGVVKFRDYYYTGIKEMKELVSKPDAQTKTLRFSSKTASSSTNQEWAEGTTGGRYSFFSASASASGSKLSQRISSSGITVDMTVTGLQTRIVGGNRGNWFTLAALSGTVPPDLGKTNLQDYATSYPFLYNHNNGSLRLWYSELIVVKSVTCTVTIESSLSDTEVNEFRTSAEGGIWPFFQASGQGGWKTSDVTSTNDTLTYTTTAESTTEGDPLVLAVGAKVVDMLADGVQ